MIKNSLMQPDTQGERTSPHVKLDQKIRKCFILICNYSFLKQQTICSEIIYIYREHDNCLILEIKCSIVKSYTHNKVILSYNTITLMHKLESCNKITHKENLSKVMVF